jgi:hypothetical protein
LELEATLRDPRHAWRQPSASATSVEIEDDLFWIAAAGPADRIESAGLTDRVAKQEVQLPFVLERAAKVGSENAESFGGLAERRLLHSAIDISSELRHPLRRALNEEHPALTRLGKRRDGKESTHAPIAILRITRIFIGRLRSATIIEGLPLRPLFRVKTGVHHWGR